MGDLDESDIVTFFRNVDEKVVYLLLKWRC